MPLKKDQKKAITDKLVKNLSSADSAVFVQFGKLTVNADTEMRRALRENGVGYFVSKKTLLKRAFDESKIDGTLPPLEGQIAIAYGEDAILPAKSIAEFQVKLKDKISIVGGILSGKFMSASEMIALSKIPTREVLLGQLLNVMNAPVQGFVMALDQISKKTSEAVDIKN